MDCMPKDRLPSDEGVGGVRETCRRGGSETPPAPWESGVGSRESECIDMRLLAGWAGGWSCLWNGAS